MTPSIGISKFFKKQSTLKAGNSYTNLTDANLIEMIHIFWHERIPGTGEGDCLTRKVLVPLPIDYYKDPAFFLPPRMALVEGMPIKAKVIVRQKGEKPFVETFITVKEAKRLGWQAELAEKVMVVCYSAEALLENNGQRSTDADWEVVCLLCSASDDIEPMLPLTMARNQLEMDGGTKPAVPYTSDEWAKAVWEHSIKRGIRVCNP